MTEDDPTLDEIAELARRIELTRAEAKSAVDDLAAARDRRIAAYVERHARSVTTVGRAARLSRQRVDTIVRRERAKRDQS